MACSHLLSKNGICPCGWRKPEPPPDPALVEAWWDDFVAAWCEVSIAHAKLAGRARAAECRRRFSQFVRDAWEVLRPGVHLTWTWYIEAICDHIQWVLEGWRRGRRKRGYRHPVRDIAFSVPPGTMKTFILSICAPAWMWIDSPEWSVLCLSVNPGVARDSAVASRQLIASDWYRESFVDGLVAGENPAGQIDEAAADPEQPFSPFASMPATEEMTTEQWSMSKHRDTQGKFVNSRGGFRASAGLSAQIIGARADAVFIDDPNDPRSSVDGMQKLQQLYAGTLYSRVNDLALAVRVIIQQRVDSDDLTGFATKTFGTVHFVLPLLFEPERRCTTPMPVNARGSLWLAADGDSKIGTWQDPRVIPGECISTIRFSDEDVAKLKLTTTFNAFYQQDPDRADGEHFKVAGWRYWRFPDQPEVNPQSRHPGSTQQPAYVPTMAREQLGGGMVLQKLWVTMDATMGATTEKASHIGLMAVAQITPTQLLVLHDGGKPPSDLWAQLEALDETIRMGVEMTGHRAVHVLIEIKALGETIMKAIRTHIAEHAYQVGGLPVSVSVEEYNPGKEPKDSRGYAMEPAQTLGQIYLWDGAPWLAEFLREFRRFPRPPNDRVDALAQLVSKIAPAPGAKYKGWAGAAARMGASARWGRP